MAGGAAFTADHLTFTHLTMIALGLALPLAQARDSSPGGAEDVLLLADGTSGLLLADGSGLLLLSH